MQLYKWIFQMHLVNAIRSSSPFTQRYLSLLHVCVSLNYLNESIVYFAVGYLHAHYIPCLVSDL